VFTHEQDFLTAEEIITAALECIRSFARGDVRAVTYWTRRMEHYGSALALSLDLRAYAAAKDKQLELLKEGSDQGGTQQV